MMDKGDLVPIIEIVDNMAMWLSAKILRVTMHDLMDHFDLESNRSNGTRFAPIAHNRPQFASQIDLDFTC